MKGLYRLLLVLASAGFFLASAHAQNAGTVTNHAFAIGKGAGVSGYTSLLCGSAQLAVGQSAADPICRTLTGDVTIDAAGVTAIGSGKVTTAKLASGVQDTILGYFGSTSASAIAIPNCTGALVYSTGSHSISCNSGVGTVTGPGSSTDKAAALFSGTGGTLLQNSPLLVDTTTGALTRNGGGGIAVQASNTNAAACSGCIGDYMDAPAGGGMTTGTVVPTSTTTTVNSIASIPAGDWMVQCGVLVCPTAATLTGVTELHISLSDTTAALMSPPFGAPYAEHVPLQDNQCQYRTTGTARWNNSSARTTYCVARMTYTGGSATVQSWMYAYRFH